MYDKTEFDQRTFIIKNSTLDDAIILDRNYKILVRNALTKDEERQFEILRLNVQRRIDELTGIHGKL